MRRPGLLRPNVLAIASSTGGPQALNILLKNMTTAINAPIVITQHMPPTFTSILAQHVGKASGWPCHEAVDGEPLQAGTIYIAPGDKHLTFEKLGAGAKVRLSNDPPENFCRPAVDPMLRSLAGIYGPRILTVVLTGMGSDGLKGGREVVAQGGTVFASRRGNQRRLGHARCCRHGGHLLGRSAVGRDRRPNCHPRLHGRPS